MGWKPKSLEAVYVKEFRTLPSFHGIVIEQVGCGYNVRHPDGSEWFREDKEMRPLTAQEQQGFAA